MGTQSVCISDSSQYQKKKKKKQNVSVSLCSRGKPGLTYSRTLHTFVMVAYNNRINFTCFDLSVWIAWKGKEKKSFTGSQFPGSEWGRHLRIVLPRHGNLFFSLFGKFVSCFFSFSSYLLASRVTTITYRRDEWDEIRWGYHTGTWLTYSLQDEHSTVDDGIGWDGLILWLFRRSPRVACGCYCTTQVS